MPKPTFTIGVFATIFDEQNRVLLAHRNDYDLWNLPGGCLDHGETPWQGVIREVKEETGLEVEVDYLAGVYSKPDKNEVIFQFVCRKMGGQLTLNEEARALEYFAFDDIPTNTSPKQVDRIKDILDNRGELIMKTQIGK